MSAMLSSDVIIATDNYERDFVTVLGTLRLRIARTRGQSFLPAGLEKFQRRAPEVSLLIREAFLVASALVR